MSKNLLKDTQRDIEKLLEKPAFLGWTKEEARLARHLLSNTARIIPQAIHAKKRIRLLERGKR